MKKKKNLIISCKWKGIYYLGPDELIKMIYNSDFKKHTNLSPFSNKPFFCYAVTYILIKYPFVSKDEAFIFSFLPDPANIWLLQLALLWTWWFTTTGLQLVIPIIVLIYCFQIVYAFVSLAHFDFVSVTSNVTYINFIRLLSLIVSNQTSKKSNGD